MSKQLDLYDSFPINPRIADSSKNMMLSDSGAIKDGYSLVCDIDATHSGTLINNRVYPPDGMAKGIKTWTKPYKKPVLVNHNDEADPIGRVIKAQYIKTPRGMDGTDYKPVLKASDGFGYTNLTVKVTDPDAIQKIMDGRYETVSVRMTTNHAFCSICGVDWSDEMCDHMPGKMYDKKLAYITTGDLSYREVSFVNIPADEYAKVTTTTIGDSVDVPMYASNTEGKALYDMGDVKGDNLYDLLEQEVSEEDDVIIHLLRNKDTRKEEKMSMKLEELTKDQLKDLDMVKEMIQEALDGAKGECESQLAKLREELEKKDSELNTPELKDGEVANAEALEAQKALSDEKESLGSENTELKDEINKRDEERKTLLDENVRLNADLHKLYAERLYDLKIYLGKPDVTEFKTPEDRDKKVEEFAGRSIESLRDQIGDLLLEQGDQKLAPTTSAEVESPGVSHQDNTNDPNKKDKKEKKETKKDTLDRMFGKK